MKSRSIRFGLAVGLVGFLVVFFIPFLPYSQAVSPCLAYGSGFYESIPCTQIPPGGSYSGYQSVGRLLTGWGAVYSEWLEGYIPPAITVNLGDYPTTLGAGSVLFAVILPIGIALAWLFAPELVGRSKVSRFGFGGFGVSLFVLCDALVVLMGVYGGFPRFGVLLTLLYGASGVLMILYASHLWPLGTWVQEETQTPMITNTPG